MAESNIAYLPLNQKSNDYIVDSIKDDTWLSILEGGKRASKNVISILAWSYIVEGHKDKLHLAGGFTYATAKTNVIDCNGFGLEHIFKGRCRIGKYDGNQALYINEGTDKEKIVLIIGGGKSDSYKSIKGMTIGTAYLDEANELHETFVKEVNDRLLSSSNIKQICTLNPKDPNHWFYENLDRYEEENLEGYVYYHFTIEDNPAIDEERKAHILATYDTNSLWYKRDILGIRLTAEGLCYGFFANYNEDFIISEYSPKESLFVTIGIDFGGNKSGHAFNATSIEKNFKGVTTILDYWSDKPFTPTELETEFVKFVKQVRDEGYTIKEIRADSAEQVLIRGFRKALLTARIGTPIKNATKGLILDRIAFYNKLHSSGSYRIHKRCKATISSFNTSIWDEKHPDERLDDGTINIDNLDAQEYSTEPYQKVIVDSI